MRILLLLGATLLFFIFPLIWWPGYHPARGTEQLSDLLYHQYFLESILNGFFPYWNPFHDGGLPFYSFASALCFGFVEFINAVAAKIFFLIVHPLGISINTLKLTLFSNYIYLLILFSGCLLLFRKFTKDLFLVFCFSSLVAFNIGNFNDNAGLYITILQIFAFVPYVIFFTLELFERCDQKSLFGFLISLALLITQVGLYIVPMTIIIISLMISLLLFREGSHPYQIARKLSLLLSTNRLYVLICLISFVLMILPPIVVWILESQNIVRENRNLFTTTFSEFLSASQGSSGFQRLLYIDSGNNKGSPYYTGILFYILTIYGLLKAPKSFRFLKLFLLFLLSVFLMDKSPLLILYYKILFPFLRAVRYWALFYDISIFFFSLFAIIGLNQLALKTKPLSHKLNYGIYFAAAISLILAIVFRNNTPVHSYIISAVFLVIVLIFNIFSIDRLKLAHIGALLICFDIAIRTLFSNNLGIQVENSQLELRPFDATYDFSFFRKNDKRNTDPFGFYALINRELTHWQGPNNFYIHLKNKDHLYKLLGNDRIGIDRTFGVTTPILRITSDFKTVYNNDEMWSSLKKDPKGTYVISKNRIPIYKNQDENGIQVLKFSPNELKLNLVMSKAALLLWLDSYHSSWEALLDGRLVQILNVNGNFKGVYVDSAGKHDLTFLFIPKLFRYSLYSSYLAFSLALGFLLVRQLRKT